MTSLVADYSGDSESEKSEKSEKSDSDSESSSAESEQPESPRSKSPENVAKLPKPDFDVSASKNSVFSNPFTEEENAKKAILEKHVKMVPTKDKVQMINGRKICWNYRKGRCRFGHTCTFAHDSDLHNSRENQNQVQSSSTPNENSTVQNTTASTNTCVTPTVPKNLPQDSTHPSKRKRPGLSNNITPSKKVLKIYKKQKLHN